MSGGTGIGFIDEGINVATNVVSGGTVGFGEDGFGQGVVTKEAIKGVKEITGANAAEEANKLARTQYEDQVQAARADRANAIATDQRNQLNLSNSATGARTGANNKSNNKTSVTGDVTDFLGL